MNSSLSQVLKKIFKNLDKPTPKILQTSTILLLVIKTILGIWSVAIHLGMITRIAASSAYIFFAMIPALIPNFIEKQIRRTRHDHFCTSMLITFTYYVEYVKFKFFLKIKNAGGCCYVE